MNDEKAALDQLGKWAEDPEIDIFVRATTGAGPFTVTYRGILKSRGSGRFYVKADGVLSPIRGIDLDFDQPHGDVSVSLEPGSDHPRVMISGKMAYTGAYTIEITDVDPFESDLP